MVVSPIGGASFGALGPALDALRGAEVVHAIPGRCRLRLAPDRRVAATYSALEQSLPTLPGVLSAEPHQASGSVVIRFDPRQLPLQEWVSLATTVGIRVPEQQPATAARFDSNPQRLRRTGLLQLATAGALGAGAWRVGSAALAHPVPLVTGAATLVDEDTSSLTLHFARPGAAVVRMRASKLWSAQAPGGCVGATQQGWLVVRSTHAGTVEIAARLNAGLLMGAPPCRP